MGCTLITDPGSFEGEPRDGGMIDAQLDATLDARLDGAADVPDPECCGDSCFETPLGTFSQPMQTLRLPGRALMGIQGRHTIQLVRTEVGLSLIRPPPGLDGGYEVHPVPSGGVQPLVQWLQSTVENPGCLSEDMLVLDVDVKQVAGQVSATLVRPSVGGGFDLVHVGTNCVVHAANGMPEGFASAGTEVAYSRGKMRLAPPGDPPNLLFRDADEFRYDAVFGVDAIDRLAIVLGSTSAGVTVEYWLDGEGQGTEGISIVTSPPRIAVNGDRYVAAYGREGRLQLEQIDVGAGSALVDVVRLESPPDVGRLAVGFDPERELIFVAAMMDPGSREVRLWAIDPAGEIQVIDAFVASGLVQDVDLLVDRAPGSPLTISYAVSSDEAIVREVQLCP